MASLNLGSLLGNSQLGFSSLGNLLGNASVNPLNPLGYSTNNAASALYSLFPELSGRQQTPQPSFNFLQPSAGMPIFAPAGLSLPPLDMGMLNQNAQLLQQLQTQQQAQQMQQMTKMIIDFVNTIVESLLAQPAAPVATPAPVTPTTPTTPTTGNTAGGSTIPLSEILSYLSAGSNKFTTPTQVLIKSADATPGSLFNTADLNHFKAGVAGVYTLQFKAAALGKQAAFAPGSDPQKIAQNIADAASSQWVSEAETIMNVAALYRGTGQKYNNSVIPALLTKWGRADLAKKVGVGKTDVESVAALAEAFQAEKNLDVRKAWLNEIFTISNGTITSPSGWIPPAGLTAYQDAIKRYQDGSQTKILQEFLKGVKT